MPPTVALIIRSFNEEAHIGRLLTGAIRQSHVPDEIIVVDSGSTDATLAIASAFDVKTVTLTPESFSFGHALNLGLSAATSEFAIFASAHVYPVHDAWVERLLRPFEDERVALTYGRQQTPPLGRFSEQRLMEQWFPRRSTLRQRHPFCNNANAAIRRSVWEQLPYDEGLTGLEDLDWAKRAMANGHGISYVAEAPVVHVHNERFSQVVNRYRREAIAHKDIYEEQHMSAVSAARLAASNIASDFVEAHHQGALRPHLFDIPKFRVAQFLGTYQGFAQSGPVTDVLRRRFYYPSETRTSAGAPDPQSEAGNIIDYDDGATRR